RAPVVEALPTARAHRALPVAGEIFRAAVEEDVVLTGHVEHALGLHGLEHLRERIEGAGFLAVGLIARVQDEGRRRAQRVDPIEQLLERRRRVAVGLALRSEEHTSELQSLAYLVC